MQDVVGRSMRKIKNLQKANAAQITYAQLLLTIRSTQNIQYVIHFLSHRTLISLGHESIVRHYRHEPRHKIFYFGVDTKLPSFGAAIAPARDALQIKFASLFTHHWSTTIPLTGIDTALVQAGADHRIVYFIWIGFVASLPTHYWHGYLLKIFCTGASCSQSAPAGDPALLSVYRRVHLVWKTSEVRIPKIN